MGSTGDALALPLVRDLHREVRDPARLAELVPALETGHGRGTTRDETDGALNRAGAPGFRFGLLSEGTDDVGVLEQLLLVAAVVLFQELLGVPLEVLEQGARGRRRYLRRTT